MRAASTMLFAILLLSVTSLSFVATFATAADADPVSESCNVFTKTYRLADMPVWSSDGRVFNPIILMAHLKATVDSGAWGSTSQMRPYGGEDCLVISTSAENHDSIATALESLRAQVNIVGK